MIERRTPSPAVTRRQLMKTTAAAGALALTPSLVTVTARAQGAARVSM